MSSCSVLRGADEGGIGVETSTGVILEAGDNKADKCTVDPALEEVEALVTT